MTKFQMRSTLEDCKQVVSENNKLKDELETTKREYLKIVEENRDHNEVTRTDDSGANKDEVMELRNRAHLLTEENQALF